MPLSAKGKKIMTNMKKEYGSEKGKQVFYASRNAGKIKGVDPESKSAAYIQGFEDYCKQAGVNPEELVK